MMPKNEIILNKCREGYKDINKADLCKHKDSTVIHDCDLLLGRYDMITLTEGGNGIINKILCAL